MQKGYLEKPCLKKPETKKRKEKKTWKITPNEEHDEERLETGDEGLSDDSRYRRLPQTHEDQFVSAGLV